MKLPCFVHCFLYRLQLIDLIPIVGLVHKHISIQRIGHRTAPRVRQEVVPIYTSADGMVRAQHVVTWSGHVDTWSEQDISSSGECPGPLGGLHFS